VDDFNADFKPDIAVGDTMGGLTVLANTATPPAFAVSFGYAPAFTILPSLQLATGNFNDDFQTDLGLVLLDLSGTSYLAYMLNATDGPGSLPEFGLPVLAAPLPAMPVFQQVFVVADFNRDALDDLVFFYLIDFMNPSMLVMMTNQTWSVGDPPFDLPTNDDIAAIFPPMTMLASLLATDFDRDGAPDLVLIMGGLAESRVALLLNQAPPFSPVPSFYAPSYLGLIGSPGVMAAGDLNLDGCPDLAVTDTGSGVVSVQANRMLRGGWPSLGDRRDFAVPLGSTPQPMAVTDFNGDSRSDLFLFNSEQGAISFLLNAALSAVIGIGMATGAIVDDDAPASVTIAAGDNQTALVHTAFAVNLAVDVRNAAGNLVQGVTATFTAPGSGPSGLFPGPSATAAVATGASGRATAPVFTANGTAGAYLVAAAAAGGSNPAVDFILANCATISISPSSVPAGTAGVLYADVTFTQTGGMGTIGWSLSGALPTGMSFAAGVLGGTPLDTGTFPLTVTATDENGCPGSVSFNLVINCPAIAVTPASVPAGTAGVLYADVSFTQTGGVATIDWSLSGALPTGMSFAAGVLGGTPQDTGTFPLTVTATDKNGCMGSVSFNLVIK